MNEKMNPDPTEKVGVYHATWERSFDKILTHFEEFIRRQDISGLLLMGAAVPALVLAKRAAGFRLSTFGAYPHQFQHR